MLDAVISAVKAVAQQEILPRYLKVARQRKVDGSLFTEADIVTQEALSRELQKIYPCPVVGEEMAEHEQVAHWHAGDAGLWCMDPIDGTSNFVNGLPYFAVSVALMRRGRSVLGAVYNPVADEMFYAEQDRGAYLNGEKLPIKEHVPALRSAMANVDLKRLSRSLAEGICSARPFSSQRNYGSCSLEWCYTAAGRFDLYLHGGQKLWDYAAGSLILEEAGGRMCGLDQDDFWTEPLWQRSAIAALDPGLFIQWRDWVRAHR
ncbi:inositol monophosphatase family protein [Nitrosovibrio sp. Nv6]|uniref:inositol monophosphatase family protein n=1 Tax=Nitrosovibrio sp. Nv6 TaxID=1855340 RepID=UPI0008C1B70C|nr:inositol monophosphatase family protein [Nitrosovibrio sp. Nv6]SEP07302.1 myo-inositol-1(or 4)-monophosphatase [Nitrosovibrio sp. Nv6]